MKNRYYRLLPLVAGVVMATSCQNILNDENDALSGKSSNSNMIAVDGQDYTNAVPGIIIVKLSPQAVSQYKSNAYRVSTRGTAANPITKALHEIRATHMEPYFVPSERFAARQHAAGLDRWMTVKFDDERSAPLIANVMAGVEGVEAVELAWLEERPHVKVVKDNTATSARHTRASRAAQAQMDDPYLAKQWHYSNDGSISPLSKAGADINLFDAWKQTTGNRKVIVNVVDGGIDPTHEDLKANFDKENSYNFIMQADGTRKGKGNIYPDADGHGTHVAGTIAATNGNGLGVCGIAGGDGTEGSGVVLLNSQVYGASDESSYGSSSGIPYGADHGAVISQNSWGYSAPGPLTLPKYDQDAIDYFIRYAGCDENGNQLPDAPMKGGVVIFAAGNDGLDVQQWPASYSECISVSAMAWDFTATPYTNRGTWVSLMAPGGDMARFPTTGGVYSTLPGSSYGYMQGTSMACPHVSGVAALVVSKFGGQGFTADKLKQILLSSVRPYDINALNPVVKGRVGLGFIDAALAVETNGGEAPETPKDLNVKSQSYTTATLQWSATRDADDVLKTAHHYKLYVSDRQIGQADLASLTPIIVYGEEKAEGSAISQEVSKLGDGTTYYFAIVAEDKFGQQSAPTYTVATLPLNNAPEVDGVTLENLYNIDSRSSLDLELPIIDRDGHSWTYSNSGDLFGVTVNREGDKLKVHVDPIAEVGQTHQFSIRLRDQYGKETVLPISYRISRYQLPYVAKPMAGMLLSMEEGSRTIDVASIFGTARGAALTYAASVTDGNVAETSVEGSKVTIKGKKIGTTELLISVTDKMGNTAANRVQLSIVRKSDQLAGLVGSPVVSSGVLKMVADPSIYSAQLMVTTMRGELEIQETRKVNSQGMLELDVQKLRPGTYYVIVKAIGKSCRMAFIKH